MLAFCVLMGIFCKLWKDSKENSQEMQQQVADSHRQSEGLSGITINLCGGYYVVSKDVPRKGMSRTGGRWGCGSPLALRALAPVVSGVIASHNVSLLSELTVLAAIVCLQHSGVW